MQCRAYQSRTTGRAIRAEPVACVPKGESDPVRSVISRVLSGRLRRYRRGQSLVELAVILPVLLLLVAGTIDLGRAFFARVAIENAAKEGAIYGAMHPECDVDKAGCGDPANVEWHILQESPDPNVTWSVTCLRGGLPIVPLTSCQANDTYKVTVELTMQLVTPILSSLFGAGVEMSSTATAVVFSDAFAMGSAPPFVSTAPNPSANPPGQCLVPQLIGQMANKVDDDWDDRGFTGTISKAGGPGNFKVAGQSLLSGTWWPCTSGITVSASSISPSAAPTVAPTATPSASPTPTAAPTPGGPTPSPTATPSPTPSPACKLVPTLEGFTVSQARTKWFGAGFTGSFTPASGQTNKDVVMQTTNPPSVPGDCIPPSSTVTVTYR